jgi:hypothetical protein
MNEFVSKLHRYQRSLNLRIIARAVVAAVLCFVSGLHIYYLAWLNLPSQSRILFYANLLIRISLVLVILFILLEAYRRLFTELKTARWLDLSIDHKDDLYQNLYELKGQGTDRDVIEAMASAAAGRLRRESHALPRLYPSSAVFVIMFIALGIGSLWALSWQDFRMAFRQFYTNRAEAVAYKRTIELSPGNATVGRNSQLIIKVLDPDPRLNHRLFYRWDKQWRELGMTDNSLSFNSLEYSIEYYVKNEVAQSPVYKVECLDEPMVMRWELNYKYPAYTGLGTALDTLSQGNIEAIRHSEVILSLTTNIPVRKAEMKFGDGKTLNLQSIDPRNLSGRLSVDSPQTWYLELVDHLGRKSTPEEKTITVLPDNPPEVRILFPGEDVTLNQNMLLPLIISANDDFGLGNLTLHYQLNNSPPQSDILQSIIPSRLYTMDHTMDLRSLELLPGDQITYWAEVFDNSPERQSALSAKYKARFPSIEEIYREIERQESLKTNELESALDKSRDLQQDFEQKRRELLKETNPSWEDKKQLEEILGDQEKLNRQVEDVADDFQNLIDKMQANEAISAETLQKMQRIQELMQEISNEELQQAMDKLAQSLQNVNPEELRKAMENFKFSMEDFSQKIDQTLQLLESIKKEQAMEKALQISQEMEQMQDALSRKTSDQSQDPNKLAQDQKTISDKYDSLREELKNIDKMLDPAKDKDVKQQLAELNEQMKSGQLEQNLSQSQKQLMQNNRSASMQSQQEALSKMRQFTQRLAEMKNSMGGGSQQEVISAMQNAIRELLIFSKKHEELRARYGSDPYQIIADLIAHYDGIQLSLNRLFSVPQVTMFLPPKFYIDLGDANRAYREIFINVNEMQYIRIPEQLGAIQKGINLMIYDLMQTLNNPSAGSGSGSGMQSLLQMLEQMSQQQMAMNMLTEQLMMQMQQQGGRMDAAMQQQIQKLASDQQRLADNLKRAMQNNPEAQKQGNAIKQIVEEAEAISRQLKNNQLSPDLLERQENIISRLLDAQRSINKREFSEKRKAETGDPNASQSDTATDFDSLRRKAMLDDAYRLFPPSYQQVILKYLKLLNEGTGQ